MKTAVAMCTYFGEKYLAEQLDSIFGQSLLPDRLFVYDDGSGDRTWEILRRYRDEHPERVTLLRDGRHRGINAGMRYLLSRVEADAVFLCDQDDVWMPDKVKTMLAIARAQPDWTATPCIIHSEARLKPGSSRYRLMSDLIGKRKRPPELEDLFCHNLVQGCSMLVNRPLLRMMTGPMNDEVPHCIYDQWMALTATAFGRVLFCPEALMEYRIHGANTVGSLQVNLHEKYGLSRNRKLACEFLYCFGSQLSDEQRLRVRYWIRNGHRRIRRDNLLLLLGKGGLALCFGIKNV